jgi:hypothetical protein
LQGESALEFEKITSEMLGGYPAILPDIWIADARPN